MQKRARSSRGKQRTRQMMSALLPGLFSGGVRQAEIWRLPWVQGDWCHCEAAEPCCGELPGVDVTKRLETPLPPQLNWTPLPGSLPLLSGPINPRPCILAPPARPGARFQGHQPPCIVSPRRQVRCRKAHWNVRCQPQKLLECSNELACERQGFPHAAGCHAAGSLPDSPSMVEGCCGDEARAVVSSHGSKMPCVLRHADHLPYDNYSFRSGPGPTILSGPLSGHYRGHKTHSFLSSRSQSFEN